MSFLYFLVVLKLLVKKANLYISNSLFQLANLKNCFSKVRSVLLEQGTSGKPKTESKVANFKFEIPLLHFEMCLSQRVIGSK